MLHTSAIRNIPLRTLDLLIFPLNPTLSPTQDSNHWWAIAFDFNAQTITIYNSGTPDPHELSIVNALKNLITEMYTTHYNHSWSWQQWHIIHPSDLPRQQNNYDCGVYMCTYITHIAFHAPLEFDQTDIPRCRQHIARRILANTYCINPPTNISHLTAIPVSPPLGEPNNTSPDTHTALKSAPVTSEPGQNQRRSSRPPKPKKPFSPDSHTQPRAQKTKAPPSPKEPPSTNLIAAPTPAGTTSRTPPSKPNGSPPQQHKITLVTPPTRPPGPPRTHRRKPLPRTLGAPPPNRPS